MASSRCVVVADMKRCVFIRKDISIVDNDAVLNRVTLTLWMWDGYYCIPPSTALDSTIIVITIMSHIIVIIIKKQERRWVSRNPRPPRLMNPNRINHHPNENWSSIWNECLPSLVSCANEYCLPTVLLYSIRHGTTSWDRSGYFPSCPSENQVAV